jgi:hypothetical protein
MKKLLSLSLVTALVIGFSACKKNNSADTGINPYGVTANNNNNTGTTPVVSPLGDLPTSFTKKAVIEEATAAWCGYCPYGAINMKAAVDAHPDKVYGIAYHSGDVMSGLYDALTSTSTDDMTTRYSISGIPGGVVNRMSTTNNYNSWGSDCSAELSKPTIGGLGIITKKVNATTYTIDVHAGFSASGSGEYYLVAYLLEDGVHKGAAYDQHNYADINSTSPDPSSQYYHAGDPMSSSKYIHNHLLRQVLFTKGIWGTLIPGSKIKAGGEFNVSGDVEMSAEYNLNNVTVIAMIVKKGASAAQDYVENVQECKLGSIKKWD